MSKAHRAIAALGAALTLATAAVAGAVPAQASTPAGSVAYQNPAIVRTGNAVLVTAADSSGNVDYWWQAAGTGVWHEQQVAAASGGVTYLNPVIVWTGNAVLVAAADSSGNVDYWWQAAGTGVWHEQQVAAASGGLTYTSPAIVWTGNAVLVTAKDSSGNLDYWWQAAGTGVWHEQQVAAAGTVTYLNPAIVWTGNAVLVTSADSSGNLDYWWQGAGTGVWHEQPVAAASAGLTFQDPAIVWTGNAVLVTAKDSTGNLDYWWQAAGTGVWHQQQVAAAGTVTYTNPAIVATGNAVLVTAADSSGNVDYWWQAAGTGVWHEQQVAAAIGGRTFQKPAIVWTGNAVLVTAADAAGDLNYWWQAAGTGAWHPQVIAAGGIPWGDAIEVPGTATLNTGENAQVTSLSCPSAGNCTAGGDFSGIPPAFAPNDQAFVADEVNGTWGDAIEVPGLAALNTGGIARVTAVSCPSAGNCAVGGSYLGSGPQEAFVADEVNGTWTDAIEVPGTGTLNAGGFAVVSSVSCPSAGNCALGGYYNDTSTTSQAFVADEVAGSWGNAIEVPGLAGLNTGGTAVLNSVSCASAGNCAAGGYYTIGSNHEQAFVADEAAGTWGDAIELPGTATLNVGGFAVVSSVSCPSAGNCAVGGQYLDSSGNTQVFVADEAAGSWGNAIEVPGTAALNTSGSAYVFSVACASAGNCAAGGYYQDSGVPGAPSARAFAVSEVNGTWGDAFEVPGTAVGSAVDSVSCPSAGNCVAGGSYTDSSGASQAFVISEVAGIWGDAFEVPGTAALNTGGGAEVGPVSCPATGGCAAGGSYDLSGSGGTQAFVVSQT